MQIILSLGSNQGDRLSFLQEARKAISHLAAVTVTASSPVYDTEPVDVADAYKDLSFLNAIVTLEYEGDPQDLSADLHNIEYQMGRVRGTDRNAPRPVDIDVIAAGDMIIHEANLVLPHPRWSERRFVVQPLADVEPDLKLPGESRPVCDILAALPDKPTATLFKETW